MYKKNFYHFFIIAVCLVSLKIGAQHKIMVVERERPAEWDDLILGGRFMDRFNLMPDLEGTTTNIWGSDNVLPRDINNGIEDPLWSYWGGNTKLGKDGKYHLFVCRWPENEEKGHMAYHGSIVVHAVSDHSFGPYKVISEVGPGHNPEWYIAKNGHYIVYTTEGYYDSENINGPWEFKKFEFNFRERECEASHKNTLHNNTFSQREDGSFLMINRKGDAWFSKDGNNKWNRVTPYNVYPPAEGKYEDPVVWRTNVQYHLIVNDWLGRIAWYLRSKDGVNWKPEPGEAYKPGVSKHVKGYIEAWHKYERIKMLQDEYGRAYQANFAVIDTLKKQDFGNDNHSSKLICVPLEKGKLLTLLNQKKITARTKEIKVIIKAEKNFNPIEDIDFESLQFGAAEVVNFGNGSKFKSFETRAKDVIVIFDAKNNGITDENFAGKLLGKTKKGELLFGYARFAWVDYVEPILSPKSVNVINSKKLTVEVQNFGQVLSKKAYLEVSLVGNGKEVKIGKAIISELKPFEKIVLELDSKIDISGLGKSDFNIIINKGKSDEQVLIGKTLSSKTKMILMN